MDIYDTILEYIKNDNDSLRYYVIVTIQNKIKSFNLTVYGLRLFEELRVRKRVEIYQFRTEFV